MMRQLAEATDYNGLIAAIRSRVAELQLAGETIDEVADCQLATPRSCSGHAGAPNRDAFAGPLLGALGLKLIVVEDEDALRRVAGRLKRRNPNLVRSAASEFRLSHRFLRKIASKAARA